MVETIINFSWRYVVCRPNHRTEPKKRQILGVAIVERNVPYRSKWSHACTLLSFWTSRSMGYLAVIFAWWCICSKVWKVCATQAKMTAKCPMDLDDQKLSRVHVYDHFDPYMAHFARGHKKLQRFWCNFGILLIAITTPKFFTFSVRSYSSVYIRRIVMKSL